MSDSLEKARIFLVDNLSDFIERWTNILERSQFGVLGYCVTSSDWLEICKATARLFRPHVVMVDLRLENEYRPSDVSGLELVKALKEIYPALPIIVYSAYLDDDLRRRISELGAEFFKKGEDPKRLLTIIEKLAAKVSAGTRKQPIVWPGNWKQDEIVSQLLRINEETPASLRGAIDDLLHQAFSTTDVVRLAHVEGHMGGAPSPVSIGRSLIAAVRRDNLPVRKIVKVAPVERTRKEVHNYNLHVRDRIGGVRHTQLEQHVEFWDIGALIYTFLGGGDELQSFAASARTNQDLDVRLDPVIDFFEHVWDFHYHQSRKRSEKSLWELNDDEWKLGDRLRKFTFDSLDLDATLASSLRNPVDWVLNNASTKSPRSVDIAITHGDFHGDNLFTDGQRLWVVDFERTGYGHILRDLVALTADMVSRMPLDLADPLETLKFAKNIFDLPDSQIHSALLSKPELASLAGFTIRLRSYTLGVMSVDAREYYWALLFEFLLTAILGDSSEHRAIRTRSYIMASVLCDKLEEPRIGDDRPLQLPPSIGRYAYEYFRYAGIELQVHSQHLWLGMGRYPSERWAICLCSERQQEIAACIRELGRLMEVEGIVEGFLVFNGRLDFLAVQEMWRQRSAFGRSIIPFAAEQMERTIAEERLVSGRVRREFCEMRDVWRDLVNPYRFLNRSDIDPQWFFGPQRVEEARSIQVLARSNRWILIHGMRRVGKSSLVNQIARQNLLDSIPTVRIVCHKLDPSRVITDSSFFAQICDGLSSVLQSYRRFSDELDAFKQDYQLALTENNLSSSRFLAIVQSLLASTDYSKFILILDEMDMLLPTATDFTQVHPHFHSIGQTLKALLDNEQTGRRFTIFATAEGTLLNTVDKFEIDERSTYDNPLYERFYTHPISFLMRNDFDEMVRNVGALIGIKFTASGLNALFEATAGHPQIARDVCIEIVETFRDERPDEAVSPKVVWQAILRYLGPQENPNSYLRETFWKDRHDQNSSLQQEILRFLADNGPVCDFRKIAESSIMSDRKPEQVNACLQRLVDRAILRRDDTRQPHEYLISVPIFAEWIHHSNGKKTRYGTV